MKDWNFKEKYLLVHGKTSLYLENKINYNSNPDTLIPRKGEIACSIVSPHTKKCRIGGLVLKPTVPRVFSHRDLNSFVNGYNGLRETKEEFFSQDELSIDDLMFFTLGLGTVNEVIIPSENTEIIGSYGAFLDIDELISYRREIDKASSEKLPNSYKLMIQCVLSSDFYLHFQRWNQEKIDSISKELTKNFDSFGYKHFDDAVRDVAQNKITIHDLYPDYQGLTVSKFSRIEVSKIQKKKLREIEKSIRFL